MSVCVYVACMNIPVHAPRPPIRKAEGAHGDEVELDVAVGRVHFEEVRGFAGARAEEEADVGFDPQGAVFVGKEGGDEDGPHELLLHAEVQDLRGPTGELDERHVPRQEEVWAFDHSHDHGGLAVVRVFEKGGLAHLLLDRVALGIGDTLDAAGEFLTVNL